MTTRTSDIYARRIARVTHRQYLAMAQLLKRHPKGLTLAETGKLYRMGETEVRHMLTVLADFTTTGRFAMKVWTLRPTWRMDLSHHLATRNAPPPPVANHRRANPRANAPADTYPSGNPAYFSVDWMGRVIYTGPPSRQDDSRWALDTEEAA
jgi:hypothetical protein